MRRIDGFNVAVGSNGEVWICFSGSSCVKYRSSSGSRYNDPIYYRIYMYDLSCKDKVSDYYWFSRKQYKEFNSFTDHAGDLNKANKICKTLFLPLLTNSNPIID